MIEQIWVTQVMGSFLAVHFIAPASGVHLALLIVFAALVGCVDGLGGPGSAALGVGGCLIRHPVAASRCSLRGKLGAGGALRSSGGDLGWQRQRLGRRACGALLGCIGSENAVTDNSATASMLSRLTLVNWQGTCHTRGHFM